MPSALTFLAPTTRDLAAAREVGWPGLRHPRGSGGLHGLPRGPCRAEAEVGEQPRWAGVSCACTSEVSVGFGLPSPGSSWGRAGGTGVPGSGSTRGRRAAGLRSASAPSHLPRGDPRSVSPAPRGVKWQKRKVRPPPVLRRGSRARAQPFSVVFLDSGSAVCAGVAQGGPSGHAGPGRSPRAFGPGGPGWALRCTARLRPGSAAPPPAGAT